MFNTFKRFFVLLLLVFISACSSQKYATEQTVTTEQQVTIPSDENAYASSYCDGEGCDETLYQEEVIEESDNNEEQYYEPEDNSYFSRIPQYDSKLLYKELENQIQKVEIKKVLIKPVVNTSSNPVELQLEQVQELVDNISEESELEDGVEYDDKAVMVLMENYKNILKTSYSCCVANIVEKMKNSNVSQDSILSFLSKDANEYALQNMCLFVNNKDMIDVYNFGAVSSIVTEVKNDCICNNAKFIRKNLNNFYKLYNEKPELFDEALVYRFKDKKGRVVEHNINETVLNITNVLNNCLK